MSSHQVVAALLILLICLTIDKVRSPYRPYRGRRRRVPGAHRDAFGARIPRDTPLAGLHRPDMSGKAPR